MIVSSAFVISLRATNILREETLENLYAGSKVNLNLRGIITEIKLNHEVNTGYSYHIFPAYVTIDNVEFVWGTEEWVNKTIATEFWRNQTVNIGYDKLDVPALEAGQRVEVNGRIMFMEDSLYSGLLVVAPNIESSYVKPV